MVTKSDIMDNPHGGPDPSGLRYTQDDLVKARRMEGPVVSNARLALIWMRRSQSCVDVARAAYCLSRARHYLGEMELAVVEAI